MKKISILFFFYFLLTISVFAQWTKLNSGTTNYLSSVYFVNSDTGFVAGEKGTILKTTDGGVSWNPQSSGTTTSFSQIVFMDANNGVIVGDSGIVLKTTNAGQTWQRKNSGTIIPLFSVSFSSLNSGVAVGTKGTILKTNDGGSSWTRLPAIPSYSDTLYDLNSVRFSSTIVGYAGGGRYIGNPYPFTSIMLKTMDGGNSWTKIFENSNTYPFYICSLFPINDNRMWAFGEQQPNDYDPKFLYSNNGGTTWTIPGCGTPQLLCMGPNSYADGIFFTNINTGYIATSFGKIYFTIDGGISWSEQYVDSLNAPSMQFDGIFFANDSIGYIVGRNVIYKTTNGGGILGINEYSQNDNNIQIFPNPTTGVFKVEMKQFEKIRSVEIYNMYGTKVYSNEETNFKINSSSKFQIDLSDSPGGMYFVKIYAGVNNYSQKIIKLK